VDRTGKAVERAGVLPGPERRSGPRTRSRLEASYEDAEQHVFLYTADLAEGGVLLVSPIHPPVGANAMVLLELPGDPVILRMRGSVTRHQTHPVAGFAVHFDSQGNPESGRQALRSFVESALSSPASSPR
jgi:hypothetical protein